MNWTCGSSSSENLATLGTPNAYTRVDPARMLTRITVVSAPAIATNRRLVLVNVTSPPRYLRTAKNSAVVRRVVVQIEFGEDIARCAFRQQHAR